MPIRSSFFHKCSGSWRAMVLLVLSLLGVSSMSFFFVLPTYAAAGGGSANFSLQPSLYDPNNTVTRSYYVLGLQPGAITTVGVRVNNTGTATGAVDLYPVDATTGITTGTVFRQPKDPRKDVGAWIALNTQHLTLAPGQSRIVPFQVIVPKDVRSGQHVGGIMAEGTDVQTSTTKNQRFQVNVRHVFVMAVQVNLPGTAIEQLTATGIQAGGANNYQNLQLLLHNTGNMMVHGKGVLQVMDASGKKLQNLPINLDTFLPDTSIAYPVNVQNQALAAGDYQAVLDITYGHQHTLHYATKLTISSQQVGKVFQPTTPLQAPATVNVGTNLPLWQVVLVGILVLFGVLFMGQQAYRFVVVVRRRKKEK